MKFIFSVWSELRGWQIFRNLAESINDFRSCALERSAKLKARCDRAYFCSGSLIIRRMRSTNKKILIKKKTDIKIN